MLTYLRLNDFAVVSEAELHPQSGMTVITGETGAGKSLLADALLCLTGARADVGLVRAGATRAELTAEFDVQDAPSARSWLSENELDEDGECRLRRVIRADGGSKAWINGRPATLSQLAELGAMLVEIHGQHEHQALLQRGHQLGLMDAFGRHDSLLDETRRLAEAWETVDASIRALQARGDVSERLIELRQQHQDLEREVLDADALQKLQLDHRRAAHAQQLLEACERGLNLLDADELPTPARQLRRLRTELQAAQEHEPRLAELLTRIDGLQVELDELTRSLEHIRDDLPMDGEAFQQAEAKLTRLHELARRHRIRIEALPVLCESMASELDTLQNAGAILDKQRLQREQLHGEWSSAADALSKARANAAETMGRQVSALMAELGMAGGRFQIELEAQNELPHAAGRERCEFQVSANPGQPPRALRKVASGGELARISLAIEVATLGLDEVPTMIFDEVDTGIGGAVAEIVGRKLRVLGESRQVLCVTHLAQVAAQGHHQYQVSKAIAEDSTHSLVRPLGADERVQELARMLGGVDIGQAALANAAQMLASAQE